MASATPDPSDATFGAGAPETLSHCVVMGSNDAAHCLDGWSPVEPSGGRPARGFEERARLWLCTRGVSTHAGIELWTPRRTREAQVTGRLVVRDGWVAGLAEFPPLLDVAFRLASGHWNQLEFPLPEALAPDTKVEVTIEIDDPAAQPDPASTPPRAAVHRLWLRDWRTTEGAPLPAVRFAGSTRIAVQGSALATHAGIEVWAPRHLRAPRVDGRLVLRDRWVADLPEFPPLLDVAFRVTPGRWNVLEFPLPAPPSGEFTAEATLELERSAARWGRTAPEPCNAALRNIWLRDWTPSELGDLPAARLAGGRMRLLLHAPALSTHAGIELWVPRGRHLTGRLVVRDAWVAARPDYPPSLDVAFRLASGVWNRLEFPLRVPLESELKVEVTIEVEDAASPGGEPDPALHGVAARRVWLRGARITTADVVIVVLNWNKAEETITCLESLQQADLGGASVLVVDNGSRDGSAAAIRARMPQVEVLALPENRGYAGGNNAGIRVALERGAKAVLLLNNDTRVAADFLHPLVWALNSHLDVAAASAAILRMDQPETLDVAWLDVYYGHGIVRRQGVNALPGEGFDSRLAVDAGVGCCLLLAADALRTVGLLDEDYFAYHEEVDWCVRARAGGGEILYEPHACVWHGGSKSTGTLRDALGVARTVESGEALPNRVPLPWNPVRSYLGARNSVRFIRARAHWRQQLYFVASTLYAMPLELLAVLLRREEELSLGLWTYRRAVALYCGAGAESGGGRLVRALRVARGLPAMLLWRVPRDLARARAEGRLAQFAEYCRGLWDGARGRPLPLERLGLR